MSKNLLRNSFRLNIADRTMKFFFCRTNKKLKTTTTSSAMLLLLLLLLLIYKSCDDESNNTPHHHHLDPRYWELVNEKNERKWIFLATSTQERSARRAAKKEKYTKKMFHSQTLLLREMRLLGLWKLLFRLVFSIIFAISTLSYLSLFREMLWNFSQLQRTKKNPLTNCFLSWKNYLFTICLHNFRLFFSLSSLTSLHFDDLKIARRRRESEIALQLVDDQRDSMWFWIARRQLASWVFLFDDKSSESPDSSRTAINEKAPLVAPQIIFIHTPQGNPNII